MPISIPLPFSAPLGQAVPPGGARESALSGGQLGSSAGVGPEAVEKLDQAAAQLGRELGPLRLALGDALNALAHTHGYRELGFSSLSAYATERSGRPKRWIGESRSLAASLEDLATLRRQLMSGRIPWTRAEALAKIVERALAIHDITNPDAARALRPALELSWLFRGSGLTCRELSEQLGLQGGGAAPMAADKFRWLTLTIPSEDTAWFYAAARTFRRIADRTDLDAFVEALLAETQDTLFSRGPITGDDAGFDVCDRWRAQLARWRTQAEHACERARQPLPGVRPEAPRSASWPTPQQLRSWSALALNDHILTLAGRMHLNTAALGHCAEQLHRIQAWRRLGFASPGHHARDRVGVSWSSLKQKRALARRLVSLPRVAQALETGQLGSVAASLIARVATSKTERRWVERARQRTVKHLREEVTFVERVLCSRPGHRGLPPEPDVMRAELALRGAIVGGHPYPHSDSGHSVPDDTSEPDRSRQGVLEPGHPNQGASEQQHQHRIQIRNYSDGVGAGCSSHGSGLRPGHGPLRLDAWATSCSDVAACSSSATDRAVTHGQTSAPKNTDKSAKTACSRQTRPCTMEAAAPGRTRHPFITGDGLRIGRARLRVRVHESTRLLYRDVSRAFARQHPSRPLLRSLCQHFMAVWGPVLARKRKHKYEHIYERDGYACTSPVCDRHDVTPHHLKFRSRGGGDEPENLTSLCVWCHLEGVHGGRIRAEPKSDGIHWTIGRVAPIRVVDRDKVTS